MAQCPPHSALPNQRKPRLLTSTTPLHPFTPPHTPSDDLTRELEQQVITTLDVVLLAGLNDPRYKELIPLFKNNTGGLFQQRRVYDMLWGYNFVVPLPDGLKPLIFPYTGIQPNDTALEVALARHSPTRMATGAHKWQDTMSYVEWDGGNNLVCCQEGVLGESGVAQDATCAPAWGTSDASSIRGIFGTAAHPFLTPGETIDLATYPFGIYRHWPLQCAAVAQPAGPPPGLGDASDLTAAMGACDSYDVRGIRLLKFALPQWVMGNASVSAEEAAAYRVSGASGVIGVSQCVTAAPIFISRPNFLYASNSLRDALDPTFPPAVPALHDSYLGIEPLTGQVLDFHFRLGFNAYVQPITVQPLVPMTYFENVTAGFLPLGWGMQESTISAPQASTFLASVYAPLRINAGVKWAGLGLGCAGAALLALGLGLCARRTWLQRSRGEGGEGLAYRAAEEEDTSDALLAEYRIKPIRGLVN